MVLLPLCASKQQQQEQDRRAVGRCQVLALVEEKGARQPRPAYRVSSNSSDGACDRHVGTRARHSGCS